MNIQRFFILMLLIGLTVRFGDRANYADAASPSTSARPVARIADEANKNMASIIYVKADASGDNNGTSWADGYTDVQDSLAVATAGNEIWVAAGTYNPTDGTDRTATFELQSGIALYGGFNGTETSRDERDWEANSTILSGDLNSNDNDNIDPNEPTRADNSYHVVTGSGTDNSAYFSGFTITAGNANESVLRTINENHLNFKKNDTIRDSSFPTNSDSIGGGMVNNSGNPTVSHVIFAANSASLGGGMGNVDSSPIIDNVTFIGNSTSIDANIADDLGGGGMLNLDNSSPTMTNVIFTGNFATYGGGMLNLNHSRPSINDVTFTGNSAIFAGGGMYNYSSSPVVHNVAFAGNSAIDGGGMVNNNSSPTVTNVIFTGNSTYNDGGGMHNYSSSPVVHNVTLTGNLAANNGGGIINNSSDSTVSNSILWNNKDSGGTGATAQIYNLSSTPTVSYSLVQGGWSGTGNIDADPLFGDPIAPDDAPTTAGDFHLQPTSPAIDAGDNSAVPSDMADLDGDSDTSEPIPFDLDGNPRFSDHYQPDTGAGPPPIVDMGAYEMVPIVSFSRPTYSVDARSAFATITVIHLPAFSDTVTVDYATSNGTATAGEDYTPVSGTLTFTADVISQTFTIPITNGTFDENHETVVLTLSNANNAVIEVHNPATLTILNHDLLPIFTDSGQSLGDSSSYDVSMGDLDGDGDLDAFVANACCGGELANKVWLNDGRGVFNDSDQSLGHSDSRGVALGDLDGDGDLDAFVANYLYDGTNILGIENKVWLNDGHGFFTDSGQELGESASQDVALADLDGDGDLDAFVANRHKWNGNGYVGGENRVWENNGDGTFTDSNQSLGDALSAAVTLGDLNGDGHLDAFVANLGTQPSNKVWLNNGHGVFSDTNQSLGNSHSFAIALGDLDSDGDVDAFVTNGTADEGQSNKVWLNDGSGFFTDSGQRLGNSSSYDVVLGDLDGDGDLDTFVANGQTWYPGCKCYGGRENRVWLNDGSGFFADSDQALRNDSWSSAVALGDLDGDGDFDVFVGNTFAIPGNEVWLNNGGHLFANSNQNLGGLSSTDVALGDLDGDGDLDAFVANGDLTNEGGDEPNKVWLNDGRSTFIDTGQTLGDSASYAVALGDLDNDNDLDAFVTNGLWSPDCECYVGRANKVWLNNGNAVFTDSGQSLGDSESRDVALGDLDGDGDLDAFVVNSTDKIWINNGSGVFTETQSLGNLPGTSVALGDLDGDGDLDAFVSNANRSSSDTDQVLLNDGHGFFTDSGQALSHLTSMGVALGDLDGDGDLDAFVVNRATLSNELWLNGGGGIFTKSGQSLGNQMSFDVALGDLDGDGDIDVFVANSGQPIWINDGNGFFTDSGQTLADSNSNAVALGDLDDDGDLDAFVANPFSTPNRVYLGKVGGSTRFQVVLSKPGPTQDANFYSTPVILDDLSIPITYTLFDPNGATMGHVAAFYSMDGGENWQSAVATRDTITTNLATSPYSTVSITNTHTYTWDTFASGFFGQSDNVVLRLVAYSQNVHTDMTGTYHYTKSISGPYQWPYAASTTFPFRVRGTQVQVYSDTIALGHEVANALVYRLPAGQTIGALPFAADDGQPFTTDAQGYLQGHGQLEIEDRLIALLPITTTSSYTLYHTSAVPTVTGLDTFTVTTPGVQELVVSSDNPLMLFDLNISLEWDARNDGAFLEQLESDIERTSQFLYDWTNGQVALGKVRVYHAKENWLNSHVIIPASNNLRPGADLGGIVNRPLSDTLSTSQVITDAYLPGQVRMAPIWNRFGNIDDELGLDWPRTLAHELSHYLLFLPDNYLGLSEEGLLALVECQGSAMTDPYREDYSEFLTPNEWTGDCLHTLGQHTTGRADWETITTFYQMFSAENINLGPGNLPLNVTQVTFVEPETPANTLADPFFYLTDEDGIQLDLPIGQAQGYLFKTQGTPDVTDDVVMPLGVPFAEQIHARGAEPGDRLCVFDYSQTPRHLGCLEAITEGSTNLALREVSDWQPQIRVNSVTSVTLAITVTQSISEGELYVQILPAAQPITTVQTLSPVAAMIPISSDTFTQTVTLDYPIATGFVRVWISDSLPVLREEMSEFYFSGGWGPASAGDGWGPASAGDGWGPPNRYGWGISRQHGWMAPVTARDGQVTILDLDHIFGPTPIYTLQSLSTPPNLPPWLTPVGQAYRFSAAEAVTSTLTIMFDYLQREVPNDREDRLWIAYSPDDGQNWQLLETEPDTHHNHASVQMPGKGIYTLISTINIPLSGPDWNYVPYLAATRPVSEALASIGDAYTSVANYDPFRSQPWHLYDRTVRPQLAALVHDFTHLEFEKVYLIQATETITLYLGTPDSINRNLMESSGLQLPPATFYGWITPSASFTPAVDMTVTAWIDGNVCGQSTIVELDGQLAYKLQVMAENVSGRPNGCGASGRNIVFEVGDWVMEDEQEWDNKQAQFHPLTSNTPGDCNGDNKVDAGDISCLAQEIFDGDGTDPADTPGGSYPDGTAGSDANQDGTVDAGDISCVVRLIFNGPGTCGESERSP